MIKLVVGILMPDFNSSEFVLNMFLYNFQVVIYIEEVNMSGINEEIGENYQRTNGAFYQKRLC